MTTDNLTVEAITAAVLARAKHYKLEPWAIGLDAIVEWAIEEYELRKGKDHG